MGGGTHRHLIINKYIYFLDTDSSNEFENSSGQESSRSDTDQESSSEEDNNRCDEEKTDESDVDNNEDIYPELSGTHNDTLAVISKKRI